MRLILGVSQEAPDPVNYQLVGAYQGRNYKITFLVSDGLFNQVESDIAHGWGFMGEILVVGTFNHPDTFSFDILLDLSFMRASGIVTFQQQAGGKVDHIQAMIHQLIYHSGYPASGTAATGEESDDFGVLVVLGKMGVALVKGLEAGHPGTDLGDGFTSDYSYASFFGGGFIIFGEPDVLVTGCLYVFGGGRRAAALSNIAFYGSAGHGADEAGYLFQFFQCVRFPFYFRHVFLSSCFIYDFIITRSILNFSTACRAWGSPAGMIIIWPALTRWGWPDIVISA